MTEVSTPASSSQPNKRCDRRVGAVRAARGFTLIELMIVVAIIGVLASVAAPIFENYMVRARMVETGLMLGQWAREFHRWNGENGRYPNDSHIDLPAEALGDLIIDNGQWSAPTPLGGTWNWEGPDNYPYAGISIFNHTAPLQEIAQLDHILDDGDLGNGRFRQTANGRYTYILDE